MKKTLTRKGLKEISLSPYPGVCFVTKDPKVFKRAALELYDRQEDLDGKSGRFLQGPSWYHPHTSLVWWTSNEVLAHEMAHVVFGLFDTVGIRTECGNDEPFCYMLSYLIFETTSK